MNVVAISGSYRRGRITDQLVAEILRAVTDRGGRTEWIHLLGRKIEFCTNCRNCTQNPSDYPRGQCVLHDEMSEILDHIDAADAVVLAAPTNFFNVTALMRRFIERLVAYAYWPWKQGGPKGRIKKPTKKAVLVSSSACPEFLARLMLRGGLRILKVAAQCVGARVVNTVFVGLVPGKDDDQLTEKEKRRAYAAGLKLMSGSSTSRCD